MGLSATEEIALGPRPSLRDCGGRGGAGRGAQAHCRPRETEETERWRARAAGAWRARMAHVAETRESAAIGETTRRAWWRPARRRTEARWHAAVKPLTEGQCKAQFLQAEKFRIRARESSGVGEHQESSSYAARPPRSPRWVSEAGRQRALAGGPERTGRAILGRSVRPAWSQSGLSPYSTLETLTMFKMFIFSLLFTLLYSSSVRYSPRFYCVTRHCSHHSLLQVCPCTCA